MRTTENPKGDLENQIKALSRVVELSDEAIMTKSLDGIITSWNRGAEQIYGYPAKEILGKSISILEPPMLFEETKELIELIKHEERIHNYETFRIRKDGKIINVSLTLSPIFDDFDNLVSILVISRDITESKQAEKNLRRNAELYSIAMEQTGQIMYEYDLKTDKCKWAGAIEEVTGYSPEEFQKLGKYVWVTHIQPINMSPIHLREKNTKDIGDRFSEELEMRKKDGTSIQIENRGIFVKDDEGYLYKAIGVIKDITDWKIATKKVEDSERKYRTFIQNFHGIVYQADENLNPIFLHGAVEEVTGYRQEDFVDKIKWEDIIHPDDLSFVLEEEKRIRKNTQYDDYGEIEYRIKTQSGIRWVNEIYQKTQRKNEKSGFYQSTIYDITEKKEAEKFLASIETARKKEIHHRIKNNLQVISSLLDLQAEKFKNKECIKDSEVLEAFKESQDRVISMALIHEELHKGGEFDTVNFSQYIEKLANNLLLTYRLGNTSIRYNKDIERSILFDMDIAIPLGIIVNELVSNSLKYAFPGRNEGEIQIKLHRNENRKCEIEDCQSTSFTLIVSDNGIGIPENIDIEKLDSLGLQLVTTLVNQLNGELELKRDNGTDFTIRFTVTENDNYACGNLQKLIE